MRGRLCGPECKVRVAEDASDFLAARWVADHDGNAICIDQWWFRNGEEARDFIDWWVDEWHRIPQQIEDARWRKALELL